MVSRAFPWPFLKVPWVRGRTKAETLYRAFIVARSLQAAHLPVSGRAAVCPKASWVGKASSDHFRPNDMDRNKNFVRQAFKAAKRLPKERVDVFGLVFIPCPSTHPDRHLCLLPPETEAG